MRFSELIGAAINLLQSSGRMTYRALQREFDLDAETLDDLRLCIYERLSSIAGLYRDGTVWRTGIKLSIHGWIY